MVLYFYVGGVGVRQHSLYAAAAVFVKFASNVDCVVLGAAGRRRRDADPLERNMGRQVCGQAADLALAESTNRLLHLFAWIHRNHLDWTRDPVCTAPWDAAAQVRALNGRFNVAQRGPTEGRSQSIRAGKQRTIRHLEF
jgi:hypothetical protein